MSEVNKLGAALVEFGKGLGIMLESVSNFENEFECNLVLDVFNGNVNEGEAVKRYGEIFDLSFDDEVTNYDAFTLSFYGDSAPYHFFSAENVVSVLYGFKTCLKTLDEISAIIEENPNLKKVLEEYKEQEVEETPFQKLPLEELKNRFEKWSNAFHEDLKQALGEEAFNEAQIKVNKISSDVA